MIREINENDYNGLMSLYLHLHDTEIPPFDLARDVWNKILADENYHIIVAEENSILVSSCT